MESQETNARVIPTRQVAERVIAQRPLCRPTARSSEVRRIGDAMPLPSCCSRLESAKGKVGGNEKAEWRVRHEDNALPLRWQRVPLYTRR